MQPKAKMWSWFTLPLWIMSGSEVLQQQVFATPKVQVHINGCRLGPCE